MARIRSDKEIMKETRKLMELTQEEMAKELGYASRMAVKDVESGRKRLSGPARKLLESLHINARQKANEKKDE